MKLGNLFKRTPARSIPHELYGAVMAQARRPVFFSHLGVADTVIGRADLLGLHMVLLGHRLAAEDSPSIRSLSQDVFDIYVDDLDRALRELGVGDTSVPKRKKRLVHGYYGQLATFVPAMDARNPEMLVDGIAQRFHGGAVGPNSQLLAGYVVNAADVLAQVALADIRNGRLDWPDPLAGERQVSR